LTIEILENENIAKNTSNGGWYIKYWWKILRKNQQPEERWKRPKISNALSLPKFQIVTAASVGRGANTRKQRREGCKVSNVDVDTSHFMAAGEGDSNGSQIEIVLPSCSIRPPTRLWIVMEEGGAIVPETPGGNVEGMGGK